MNIRSCLSALSLSVAMGLVCACSTSSQAETAEAVASRPTLYLVRHAEKQTGDDPALTEAGNTRAAALADRLEDAGIEAIWSTDYRRTLQTAAPLAQRLDLEVQVYDPGDLASFAEQLKTTGETALVVGHSNTTPQLAGLLGGNPGPEIVEASEYDRIYVIRAPEAGAIQSEIQRYGAPPGAEPSID